MSDFVAIFNDRYSTALLADSAYRANVPLFVPPSGLSPLDRSSKLAGPVVTVLANNDLVTILGAVHRANPGDCILIANQTFEVALIGDLIATEAHRKGLAGIIVDGLVRDATTLIDIGLPVFCRGLLPIGPLKLPPKLKGIGEIGPDLALGDIIVKSGSWAFGDADGVIFIDGPDLPATFELAEKSWQREEALTDQVHAGTPLGDLLAIDAFLVKRNKDPHADFNQHLAQLGRAI